MILQHLHLFLTQDHASSHRCQHHTNYGYLRMLQILLVLQNTPAKLDDLWPIERVWAIMTQQVYQYPAPETIEELSTRK